MLFGHVFAKVISTNVIAIYFTYKIKKMSKRTLKSIFLPITVLAIVAIFMSSCQRGYGCPYSTHAKVHSKR